MNEKLLTLYFDTIDIKKKELSLEFVHEIQKKHLSHFSFNSIAVLLGQEIFLDIEKIVEKLVVQRRGGYCFEHNALMYEILRFLGFDVRLLVGKVLNNQHIDVPKTHRITLLNFEGKEYLIDVGFGAYCPRFPVEISSLSEYDTHRLVKTEDNNYQLEIPLQNKFFTLYQFNLNKYTQADCIMGNFYSSNYKNAVFVNNLVISLIYEDRILSLRNKTYHKIYKETKEVIEILSFKQLQSILKDEFCITVSEKESKFLFEKVLTHAR